MPMQMKQHKIYYKEILRNCTQSKWATDVTEFKVPGKKEVVFKCHYRSV